MWNRARSEYFDGNPTPDDLPMGERTMDYTNGDKYQVSSGRQCSKFRMEL